MKNIKLKVLLLVAVCGIFGAMFGQSAWADDTVAKAESQVVLMDGGTGGGTSGKSFSFTIDETTYSYTAKNTAYVECNWEGSTTEFVVYLDGKQQKTEYISSNDAECSDIYDKFEKAIKAAGLTKSKKANQAPIDGTTTKNIDLKEGNAKLSIALIYAQNKPVEVLCGKEANDPNANITLRVLQSGKYKDITVKAKDCGKIRSSFLTQLDNAGFTVNSSSVNIGGDNVSHDSGTGNGGTSNGGTGTGTDTGSTGDGPVNQKTHADGATILTGCWNKAEASGKGEGIVCILTMVVDVLTVGIGVLGVLGITVVGIQYLTAGGSEEQTRKAKRRLFEIIIGLVGYVLVYALLKFLMPSF